MELPTCSLAVAKANSRTQLLTSTLGKGQVARLVLELAQELGWNVRSGP